MSIKLMAYYWEAGPENQSERFVLLALADHANDEGECWPWLSLAKLARKTCMTERGLRAIIRRLEAGGWLSVEEGGGRNKCNTYRLKTRNDIPPERGSARNADAETRNGDAETRNATTLNPECGSSSTTYIHKEPLEEKKRARDAASEALVQWASPQAVASFLAYRKQRSKPLTATAAARLANNLRDIFNAGGSPDDALGLAEERGWQTVTREWYFNAERGANNKGRGMAEAFAAVASRSAPRAG
jgi:hypothetical protein